MYNIKTYQFNSNLEIFFRLLDCLHCIAIVDYIIMYIFLFMPEVSIYPA